MNKLKKMKELAEKLIITMTLILNLNVVNVYAASTSEIIATSPDGAVQLTKNNTDEVTGNNVSYLQITDKEACCPPRNPTGRYHHHVLRAAR